MMSVRTASVPLTLLLSICFVVSTAAAEENLKRTASWNWPELPIFEQHVLSYMDQVEANPQDRGKVDEYWQLNNEAVRGPDLLERLLGVGSLLDPRIGDLVNELSDPSRSPVQPSELPWLTADVR